MTFEELAARLADVERRLDLLTQRLLYGPQSTASTWRPEWAPPKEQRPRCGVAMKGGKSCSAPVMWDRVHHAPYPHGRCSKHFAGISAQQDAEGSKAKP